MKIGTLTFHQALNYGALLQTYALEEKLSLMGADCEVIDYKNKKLQKTYRPFYLSSNSFKSLLAAIIYYPIRISKKQKFKTFKKTNINISKQTYNATTKFKMNDKYDIFVVGSDQVWNYSITGDDWTYLLDFADESKILYSYAASMGMSEIANSKKDNYEYYLKRFNAISIREKGIVKYLEELTNKEIYYCLDPVFLLPKEKWENLASKNMKITSGYVFAFCLHENKVYEYAEKIAKEKHLKIICIPDSIKAKISGKKIFNAGVDEFLAYIMNAEYVVTDSFHATAFSIIFEKQFFVLLKDKYPELNQRLTSLLDSLNLSDRILVSKSNNFQTSKNISFNEAKILQNNQLIQSEKYLQKIIQGN